MVGTSRTEIGGVVARCTVLLGDKLGGRELDDVVEIMCSMFPSRTASHSVWATLVVNLFARMTPCRKHHQMEMDLMGELT
jgi:hypothetical protein